MNPSDRFIRNPRVALAPAPEGYLAYDIDTCQLHRLNPAAALIVELSDGTRSATEVSEAVAGHLAEGRVGDCLQWMAGAVTDRLLVQVEGDPPPPGPPPIECAELAGDLRGEGHVLAAFVCQHYATMSLGDDPEQWEALAELAHIVGRREEAHEAYERYAALAPGDAEVEQILVALRDDPPPPRAPDRCIVQLYARFAEFYERNMCADLEYQAPAWLGEALDAELDVAADLDVFELGCGTGLAAPHLRRRARRLVGVDLSPQMVERARSTGLYDQLDVAEITEWLSRANARDADLIAACDTFMYFGDLRQVLLPAARRLRAGGRLVFTVERDAGSSFRLTDSGRYAHSEAHIRLAASDAGLRIVTLNERLLRYEYGNAVMGLVALLDGSKRGVSPASPTQ